MSYIKLKVRSGGVYLKQKKDWQEIQFGNLFLYPPSIKIENNNQINLHSHPEDSNQKVLPLVRDSSIKGLFSYLMGETAKLRTEIEKSHTPMVQKLNATLNKMVKLSAYKKTLEPFITTFFERRDVHTRNIIYPSSVSLQNYSIETAEPTIKHLEIPLKNIMGTNSSSLREIHSFFKRNEIKPAQPDYIKATDYILKCLELYSKENKNKAPNETRGLITEWQEILEKDNLNKKKYQDLTSSEVLHNIKAPKYNKLKEDFMGKLRENKNLENLEKDELIKQLKKVIDIKQANKKKFDELKPDIQTSLKEYFYNKIKNYKVIQGLIRALKKIIDEKPISFKVITLIEEICKLNDIDSNFSKKIQGLNNFQFSSFTNLDQTKAWVNKEYYPVVRGTPSYIACVDFDVYLSESNFLKNNNSEFFSWEEIVNKFKAGPNIARWGEGGVVFIDYSGLEEFGCPHDTKDQMFVEISALKKAGLKIKKYDWEQEKTSTIKTKKIKGEKS